MLSAIYRIKNDPTYLYIRALIRTGSEFLTLALLRKINRSVSLRRSVTK